MRFDGVFALSLCWLGALACGRSDGGSGGDGSGGVTPNPPVSHTLARSMPVTISAGAAYGFNFFLPTKATFRFSVNETTTDTWNVAVFTPAQWVSYQNGSGNQAFGGVHNGVMQAADSLTIPSGEWYLGFRCTNAFQRCMFVFDADAVY